MRASQTGDDPKTGFPDLGSDRFEIVKKLGEGGMATVYRAFDRETRSWVALKVLHARYVDKPRIRTRFVSEAKAMMRLRHRNVIHVTYLNGEAYRPYFAMELAEGGCVVEYLAEHGAMPPKMATDVAIQVCKGLGAAHRQGVIHRDVKPHNILVNRRGVCKITDFGIAQLDDDLSLTRTGSVMGTLGYIAPEQRANAKDVDERSDVYSVGATLFTMLTARTTMDLFFAEQEPEMLDGVHPALRPVITKATRYRREERHATMRELAKDLYHAKAALEDDPPDAPPLVMNPVDELDDELERLTTGEITADTPFSELGLQTTPTSSETMPPPPDFASTATPATSSGIPREHLVRAGTGAPAPRRRESRRWAVRAAVGALLPALILALTVLAMGLRGRSLVDTERAEVVQALAALEETLEREAAVVDELTRLGAPRVGLESAWSAWQAASGPARTDAVDAMLLRYRKELQLHEPPTGSPRMHLARQAGARLDRIEAARTRVDEEVDDLDRVADTAFGRVALALGLTTLDYD